MRVSVKTTKAISGQLGKAGIEKTRCHPPLQFHAKQAPGATLNNLSFSNQHFF
jgi:hypothetical protein